MQSAHCAVAPAENRPAGHEAHSVAALLPQMEAPAGDAVPAGHAQPAHCASSPAENRPAAHCLQPAVALAEGEAAEALPLGHVHLAHAAAPSLPEN